MKKLANLFLSFVLLISSMLVMKALRSL